MSKPIVCYYEKDRKHVLKNLDKFVVKAANESGGYGMLVGPESTAKEQAKFAKLIEKKSTELYCPTDPFVVKSTIDCSMMVLKGAMSISALRSLWGKGRGNTRRINSGCTAKRVLGGEFIPRGRQ